MMNEFSFELIRDVAPQPIVLEPLHTEENGVFAPPAGVNGFSQVEVAVPIPPAPVLTALSVSENGTYLPPEGTDGFDSVEVNVPDTIYMEGIIDEAFRNTQLWGILKDRLALGQITSMRETFYGNSTPNLEDTIPTIHIDAAHASQPLTFDAFKQCINLHHLPDIVIDGAEYIEVGGLSFNGCYELEEFSADYLRPSNQQGMKDVFTYCFNLRSYDERFISAITSTTVDNYGGFQDCYSLDEIHNYKWIGNRDVFLHGCCRLKSFTYQPNGSLDVGNKTVYMTNIGYVPSSYRATFLAHTHFGTEKEIVDAATYTQLKNNPDCWTADIAYSRYNRASAAETITTLPTNTGSGNPVIQFVGNMGSSTDSGAINTLTAEEIAVATTKGWTVSYV